MRSSGLMGQAHAIVHGHAADRNERQNVSCAEPRMLASDARACRLTPRRGLTTVDCRVNDLFRRGHESDDRTVVIRIDMRGRARRRLSTVSIARDSAATVSLLRPSLKFGTHSTSGLPIADC